MHGLTAAAQSGRKGGQPSDYSDIEIKAALNKSGGSERGAAKIVGCKPITIKRRKEMWERGEKLHHEVRK